MIKRDPITEFDFNVNIQPPLKKGETRWISCMPQVVFRPNGFKIAPELEGKLRVNDVRVGVDSLTLLQTPLPLEALGKHRRPMPETVPGVMVTLVIEALEDDVTPEGIVLLGDEIQFDQFPVSIPRGEGKFRALARILRLVADELDSGSFPRN